MDHCPSGRFFANATWLACAVLAHNLFRWCATLGGIRHLDELTGPDWFEIVERTSPRERSVFGFPAPGDPYWDEQTLADTQTRYPRADLTPYR
jgi:hypothetical protein